MGPPVMTAKQVKKTISGKISARNNHKKRNVLAWPGKSNKIWPVLDKEAADDLNSILSSLLASARLKRSSLPLNVVKMVKGAERKELRQKHYASQREELPTMIRATLLLGLNSVARAIVRGNAAIVLVAGDIHPRNLGDLIVAMCIERGLPVVVMDTLQNATRKHVGFGCLALGVKKTKQDKQFRPLVERVTKLSEEMIQSFRSSRVENKDEIKFQTLEIPVKSEVNRDVVKTDPASVYKYRTSCRTRAFQLGNKGKSEVGLRLDAEARMVLERVKAEQREHKPSNNLPEQGSISLSDVSSMDVVAPPSVKTEVEQERVKVGFSEKKRDWGNQDFISFSNAPGNSRDEDVQVGVKRKLIDDGPSNVDVDKEEASVPTETVPQRRKLPVYRPLVVKSIQSNAGKKKKMKRVKAAS